MNENTSKNGFKNEKCDCNKDSISKRASVLILDINVFDRSYTILSTLRKFQTEKMEVHIEAIMQELSGELIGKRLELGLLQNECNVVLEHDWKLMGSGHNNKFYVCSICNSSKSE